MGVARSPTEVTAVSSGEIESQCLALMRERLEKGGHKYQILDLGPPNQSVIEYFSDYPCSLQVVDLQRRVESEGVELGADCHTLAMTRDDFARMLPSEIVAPIDIVLGWDYFNYLNRDSIICLMDYLSQYFKKGSFLYFITATNKQMPDIPMHFELGRGDRIRYKAELSYLRPSPQYAPRVLEDMMPSFSIRRLSLLANGFQEHIFTFEKHRDAPKLNVITESSLIDTSLRYRVKGTPQSVNAGNG